MNSGTHAVKVRYRVRVKDDGQPISDWLGAQRLAWNSFLILSDDPVWRGAVIEKRDLQVVREPLP